MTTVSRSVVSAAVALTVWMSPLRAAQAPAAPAPTPPATQQGEAPLPRLELTAGRSRVLLTDFDVTRFAITNPGVADATVVEPRQILIDGKAPGTVSLIIWGPAQRLQYDVVVNPGVAGLQQTLNALFPGEDIETKQTEDMVILTGHASSNEVMLRAGEIAIASAPKAQIINLLQLPGGTKSRQVLLQVRIAEVNRQAVFELGSSVFTGATGVKNTIVRETTQQFGSVEYDNLQRVVSGGELVSTSGEMTFSDYLNLFIFSNKYNLGVLIKALQNNGNLQSLAEPNLIAYNGQEANFLAGGEIPVPVVSGASGSVAIQWKEYGVRLRFTPTIAGDVIRLKVVPEVSTLDFANGVSLGGFRIPALQTRRAQTDVELRDGQSFAIAGLLNNFSQETKEYIPLLSSLPIIGHLFKTRADNRARTELMVLVTPQLVRPLNPDEVPPLPTMQERFLQIPKSKGGKGGDSGPVDGPKVGSEQDKASTAKKKGGM